VKRGVLSEIKVGDHVEITVKAAIYTVYEVWAEEHSLEGWRFGERPRQGDRGVVCVYGPHLKEVGRFLIAFKRDKDGQMFIISHRSVKQVREG